MRGDTAAESEVEVDGRGEGAAAAAAACTAAGERRPSAGKLHDMLRKVSQSPFHNQYKTLVSSTSDSSGSSANESRSKQDGDFLSDLSAAAAAAADVTDGHQPHFRQNGVQERLHLNSQESGSKGHIWRKTSEADLDAIFVPPPEFQSSPLDLHTEIKTVGNGDKFSEPQKDLFQALKPNHTQGHFQTSAFAQNASANGHFHDVTPNSSDLFKPVPTQTENRSTTLQSKSSDLFKDGGANLFQAAKGEDFRQAEHSKEVNLFDNSPSICDNPFTSPSNKEDDLFRSPNPFYTAATSEADLFQAGPTNSGNPFSIRENKPDLSTKEDLFGMSCKKDLDVFSPSSEKTLDLFPSPITRDLFQDLSSLDDPFGATPSKQYNPFQDVSNVTADIFQPLPSEANSRAKFEITPSDTAPKATNSTPSLNSGSEMKLDMVSSPDLFKPAPPESHPAIQPGSSDRPRDIILTTPQGTKHDILQPTPFTRARNLFVSPSQSPAEMTHASTFKRPPKPLPRTRPPKPEKPPTPANPTEPEPTVPKAFPKPAVRPLPKPVTRLKPKTLESTPISPENYVVFEDVLLIGQEKCVEDWPEDSPELNPNFKPSGTLRLRRESLKMKADSDGGSGEDQDTSGSHVKKKDKKFRIPTLPRRGSKDKFADDAKEGRSRTLPTSHKSSKDYFSDTHMSAGEHEDWEHDYKQKKRLKTKVNQLLRRASTTSSVPEGKHLNGHFPQESKDDGISKKSAGKKDSVRRWSEQGTVLDDSTEEEEEGGDAQHEEKKKKKVKIRFVPHRGFAITVEKTDDEPKGAHGYTPRKGSKEKSQDEVLGAHGYTPRRKSKDDAEYVEEMKGQRLQSTSKAAFMDDEHFEKTLHASAGLNGDEDPYGMEDCKPKKTTMKLLHVGRRRSKEDMLDYTSPQKKKSSFSADELHDDDLNGMEDFKLKKPKHKGLIPTQRKSKTASGQSEPIGFSHHMPQQACSDAYAEDDITQTGEDFMSPGKLYDVEQDEICKPKKLSKLKGLKKRQAKGKAMAPEDPPGATSSDYLSEAAKAEWLAAQMDERAAAGLEDEDEEGDTDSLMEWWYTVEQWDEVPSDDEDKVIKEDESKSFTILADKVQRGLRVFNKVFMERAEVLWHSVITLHAIADDISNFHQKAKIAGITGGTTTAVGGVTAIAGLALAPFTFGASLVITAVGVGVATAGGITSASAAISDNVNNMHDRKKVETVLEEYEAHLLDIGKILHFVNQGLYKLRGHPFLRSGTQHYSEDWEIRRAVQMISLVDLPVMRAADITDTAVASVQGLFKGMDKYFIKDSRELRKGCKKEVVGQIKEVANVLNDGIVELNAIREELQDATGSM
ncbi:uncharacterized protein si:cabz01007807.1 isoform X5 [Chelmon rostratus]|uniref:uncharacterized protein si:cabz01007807.1 isoform X5 n=1 Tax=Chelmon rostratus TaxID=109905 RepID=UPI001BEA40B1|nr:uncharacterized protein si:cabz01007807.1 isoform X5 [Chelmon rostratus]